MLSLFTNLMLSLTVNAIKSTYRDWLGSWQNKLNTYRTSHGNSDIPAVTKQQLNRNILALLPNTIEPDSTFVAVQKVFQLPFSIRVVMAHEKPIATGGLWNTVKQTLSRHSLHLTRDSELLTIPEKTINWRMKEEHKRFQSRFEEVFNLKDFSADQQAAAQSAISNLVGSVSYFVGDTIQTDSNGERVRMPKGELLTCIPGRSFFPRGFVWDEGFHQLVVSEWNVTLSVSILKSWIGRMEESVRINLISLINLIDELDSNSPNLALFSLL